jgi:hypothetical protein
MKTVTLTMTDSEALDVRMALNMASSHWGDEATKARKAGNAQEAQSCEDIRAGYGALWDRLFEAEHGVPFAYDAPERGAIVRGIRAQNGLVA